MIRNIYDIPTDIPITITDTVTANTIHRYLLYQLKAASIYDTITQNRIQKAYSIRMKTYSRIYNIITAIEDDNLNAVYNSVKEVVGEYLVMDEYINRIETYIDNIKHNITVLTGLIDEVAKVKLALSEDNSYLIFSGKLTIPSITAPVIWKHDIAIPSDILAEPTDIKSYVDRHKITNDILKAKFIDIVSTKTDDR